VGSAAEERKAVQGIGAIKRVIDAYDACGYSVVMGSPDSLVTRLRRNGKILDSSAGISLSDILVFQWIADFAPWQRALVIGNSFGFSSFVISALCPDCDVDAIDAEVEGTENAVGSAVTRKIADRFFPGVQLTIGFSPQDLPRSCRFGSYDLIFIDGLHTNQQLISDYAGIRYLRSEDSIVYCHDVGIARMNGGWSHIKTEMLGKEDAAFDLHFTSFGSTVVVRGNFQLKEFLSQICKPITGVYYYFGARHIGIRSALRMLLRTLLYSTRYGTFLRRSCPSASRRNDYPIIR
jgi:predicted O-methyltransferase YrrM